MIKLTQLKLGIEKDEKDLRLKISKALGIKTEDILKLEVHKRSIDARKKDAIMLVYTVAVAVEGEEEAIVKKANSPQITMKKVAEDYVFPVTGRKPRIKPVVVGMGPAGLFCALMLARAGVPSTILERGEDVDSRSLAVEEFWRTGKLNTKSNVQFGEGGAGTFSDGKLTTGTHDVRGNTVLKILVEHGAPEEILYSHKPHVGTDVLRNVVKSMREELISLGCEVLFSHQMTKILVEKEKISGVEVTNAEKSFVLPCDKVILALGHSARDTFSMLDEMKVPMEQKAFSIGVRIEQPQSEISKAQYGAAWEKLPPSDYKLSCHLPNGRSAYTFCVCPGGVVVAAASTDGKLVTNGMSYHARDGKNINSAFLVGVNPADFSGEDALAGVRFQEKWEEKAFILGGRNFHAPAQLVGDFLADRASVSEGEVVPTYAPGVTWTDLRECLPDYVVESLKLALPIFDRKVKGFGRQDAVLTGVETRSSSPLRILRDGETLVSPLEGLYPCGEGAGFAGGIVSAAVDGIRVAEAVFLSEE